jgi:FkbM family methyltransferase
VTSRDSLLGILPHALVEGIGDRRMLRRLGAATTGRGAAQRARGARLDLLPPGALRQLRTVVDVGANEGLWASTVAELARPERLVAVEPSPGVLPRLHRRIGSTAGVTIVEAAVGDSVGRATLHVTAHDHNASLSSPRSREMDAFYGSGYAVTERVTVDSTTLDEITRELGEVSLLKIDVQGTERAVLEGAGETLRRVRWLLIECNFRSHYEDDMLFPELHALLAGRGFLLTGLSPPFVQQGVALWCDSLYTRA